MRRGFRFFSIQNWVDNFKTGYSLNKRQQIPPPPLREYQKELKDLFAMHSQRVFHRLIYFKWSTRPEPMQRPLGPREMRKTRMRPVFSIFSAPCQSASGSCMERASGALEDVARSRYSQTAGAPLAAVNA